MVTGIPEGGIMPVFRVNKTKNFTVMSNIHLQDRSISHKAKGLLSMMLSFPDDWDYSVSGLVAISVENETSIKNTLKELREHGYLVITKERTSRGTFEYIYNIYEKPQVDKPQVDKPQVDKPQVDKPQVDKPQVENRPQLNTKELNTNKTNTNESTPFISESPVSFLDDLQESTTHESVKLSRSVEQETYSQDSLNLKEGGEVLEELTEYIHMREQIGKKIVSPSAYRSIMEELEELSGGNVEKKKRILKYAVAHSYSKLIDPDRDKQKGKTKKDVLERWGLDESSGNK